MSHELRREERIPAQQGDTCTFTFQNTDFKSSIINSSNNGLCCNAFEAPDLSVGDEVTNSGQLYEIRWLKKVSASSMTFGLLKISP